MPPVGAGWPSRRAMAKSATELRVCPSFIMMNRRFVSSFKHRVNTSYVKLMPRLLPQLRVNRWPWDELDRTSRMAGSRGPGWREKPTGNGEWGHRVPNGGLALPRRCEKRRSGTCRDLVSYTMRRAAGAAKETGRLCDKAIAEAVNFKVDARPFRWHQTDTPSSLHFSSLHLSCLRHICPGPCRPCGSA
jgi:hypothetical protein